MVIDARVPILPEIYDDTMIFWDDVFAWNEDNTIVGHAPIDIGDGVAQFNERVPPIVGVERMLHQLLKPRCVEVFSSLFVFLILFVDQFEGTSHDKAFTLLDATREMQIHIDIAVDVVEVLAVGAVNIDGELPCLSPVAQVATCESIGGALEFDYCFFQPLDILIGKAKRPEWGWGELLFFLLHGDNGFNRSLPIVTQFLLGTINERDACWVSRFIGGKWQIWHNLSCLYTFEPLDGTLVAFFANLHAHLLWG